MRNREKADATSARPTPSGSVRWCRSTDSFAAPLISLTLT